MIFRYLPRSIRISTKVGETDIRDLQQKNIKSSDDGFNIIRNRASVPYYEQQYNSFTFSNS